MAFESYAKGFRNQSEKLPKKVCVEKNTKNIFEYFTLGKIKKIET